MSLYPREDVKSKLEFIGDFCLFMFPIRAEREEGGGVRGDISPIQLFFTPSQIQHSLGFYCEELCLSAEEDFI